LLGGLEGLEEAENDDEFGGGYFSYSVDSEQVVI